MVKRICINEIIERFTKDVKNKIPSSKIYLFGSYATGKSKKDSDIDIAVFSDFFKGMEKVKADIILYDIAEKYDCDIQPIAFTFDDMENDFVKDEILKFGKAIS